MTTCDKVWISIQIGWWIIMLGAGVFAVFSLGVRYGKNLP